MPDWVSLVVGLPCIGILLLVFGGGGIYLIYLSIKNRQQAAQSQSWPSTAGQVVDARVVEGASGHDDMSENYVLRVEYEYTVAGTTYRSHQAAFGPRQSHRHYHQAQAQAGRYPVGAPVTVFYNPDNPQDAVLERRAPATTATLIVGIAFLGAAACLGCPLLGALALNLLGLMPQ